MKKEMGERPNRALERMAVTVGWSFAVGSDGAAAQSPAGQVIRALGDFQAMLGRFHDKLHFDAQMGEHIDKCIGAEEVDPAAKKITYARLGYSENPGRLGLLEPTRGDPFL